jgi:hypothetical protein
MTVNQEIDWSVFDPYSESTCACLCGCVFRSHSKFVTDSGIVSRKPCPECGKHALQRASSDPETMNIERKDLG